MGMIASRADDDAMVLMVLLSMSMTMTLVGGMEFVIT